MIAVLLFLSLFIFLLMGMPVAFAIGLSSLIAILLEGFPLEIVAYQIISGSISFSYSSIPFFILAGELMSGGKLTQYLVDFAEIFVGHLRGGLGHINILASMFFAGITGSATSDTVALGSIEIPMMVNGGYDKEYSTAITIASSVIGPIIPPSLTFIIYALSVGKISIGGLFVAAFIPGILIGMLLMIINYYLSKKRNYPIRIAKLSWEYIWGTTKKSIVILVMPIIIVGGIVTGIYTPTEAAAIACLYALVISLFLFKTFEIKELPKMLFNSAKTAAIIVFILGVSNIFAWVVVNENVPRLVANLLLSITDSKIVFLLLVNVALLIIGCVIDTFPAIIIFAPIFAPIAAEYGVHPIHFGVIFCTNILVGLNTPPIGTGLFLGASVGQVAIKNLIKEVIPFVVMEIIAVLFITYIPILVLWLPSLLGFK